MTKNFKAYQHSVVKNNLFNMAFSLTAFFQDNLGKMAPER